MWALESNIELVSLRERESPHRLSESYNILSPLSLSSVPYLWEVILSITSFTLLRVDCCWRWESLESISTNPRTLGDLQLVWLAVGMVLWRGFYVEDFGFPLQNTFSVFMWFASLYSNFHIALLILVAIWILSNHLYWTLIVSLAYKWLSHKIGYLRSKYMPSVLGSIFSICSWFFFNIY